jgi:hypothetical protein
MKKLVKIELKNTRFQKTELKEHASEFILYSRYSGYTMEGFNEHLRDAKLIPVKTGFLESYKLEVETSVDNARIITQLTKLYPSFGNWKVRAITSGVDIAALPSANLAKAKKKSKPSKAAEKKAKPKKEKKQASLPKTKDKKNKKKDKKKKKK